MRNYEIEKEMYRLAVELIEKRYPTGWGGAGVVHRIRKITTFSLDEGLSGK